MNGFVEIEKWTSLFQIYNQDRGINIHNENLTLSACISIACGRNKALSGVIPLNSHLRARYASQDQAD
jgi:hypothetical protein